MAQRTSLSEAQVELLRWIGAGCPPGIYEGTHHRISVAALTRRGLVDARGHGPTWTATLTSAGRSYLDQVDGSNPPLPRQANLSVTEQLVADVIEAGGTLQVPRHTPGPGQVDWQNRVRQAIRRDKVPPGKQLTYIYVRDKSTDEIQLIDAPEGTELILLPVPVPERVARYHPTVQTFRKNIDRLEVSDAALPRASRILQALVVESETRGLTVTTAAPATKRSASPGWSAPTDGHIALEATGATVRLRISEEGLKTKSRYQAPLPTQSDPFGVRGIGTYRQVRDDKEATGRLTIEIVPPTHRSARTTTWADRKSWTLEDKLPDILAEVAVQIAEAGHARDAAEQKRIERHAAWEQAMEQARDRHHQARCAEALTDQVDRWSEATRIRGYCDHAIATHPEDLATHEWITWARARADELDPLRTAPTGPDRLVDPQPDQLRPFLKGFSPYGPDANW